jgi:asparagine synthase (glutamine-hydrolysing)
MLGYIFLSRSAGPKMPGLHVRVAGPRGGRDDGGLSVALGRRLHSDGYRAAVLAAEGGVEVGRTLYEGYPISSFSGPKGRLVVVDGMIYGADPKAAASALSGLVPPGAGPGDLDRDALRAWVEGTDGDYVVLLYDRREGVVTVVNDHLGGLPLYYAEDGGALVLSREMDLVAGLLREPRLDRRSLAERLLFRFALGVRTLVEGLRRVPPATVATIDGSTARLSLTRLLDWDLGARPASGETLGECARRLSSLLVEASRARAASVAAAGRVAVVSLSGGLDSRSVAAAFVRAGSAPPAATFVEAGRAGQNRRDVRAAEEVARALGLPWERFALAPGTIEDIERSMRTRGGHAYLPVAHLDAFYRALASRHGAGAVMLTGDGGDKLLPPVVPAGGVGSMGELVGLVLERNAVIGLERLEGLAGVGEGEMRASLAAHLAGYPEADLGLKYLHFVLFERGCNWVFEGMDGSRNHLWRCSPYETPR